MLNSILDYLEQKGRKVRGADDTFSNNVLGAFYFILGVAICIGALLFTVDFTLTYIVGVQDDLAIPPFFSVPSFFTVMAVVCVLCLPLFENLVRHATFDQHDLNLKDRDIVVIAVGMVVTIFTFFYVPSLFIAIGVALFPVWPFIIATGLFVALVYGGIKLSRRAFELKVKLDAHKDDPNAHTETDNS